jgi:hypothetical protein
MSGSRTGRLGGRRTAGVLLWSRVIREPPLDDRPRIGLGAGGSLVGWPAVERYGLGRRVGVRWSRHSVDCLGSELW